MYCTDIWNVHKRRHLPRRCFKFTKATSNSWSFSFSSSSVSKVLSEPPESLEDTCIASPKSESPFGKVTLPLFTVSSPWTSEKDHNTYPCCLGIEPRAYGLEARWINHWATGTLSKGRPRQNQSWLGTSLRTTTGCCVGRLGGCCCHL